MAGNYLRGALVSFMPTFLIPLPNVIVFQYNPETIEHAWTPAAAAGGGEGEDKQSNPLAVKGLPGETFSFTLSLDANDMIADGSVVAEGIATVSGVYTRIAALEMLLYPTGAFGGGLLGSVSASVGAGGVSTGGATETTPVPQMTVPATLFVWGPGRIVPVRVTGLSFTENIYDGLLNPTQAEAKITLKVMTKDELTYLEGPLKEVCELAYDYSQGLRQVLAVANLANSVESIIGMLPV
jgi:hypothetical protein